MTKLRESGVVTLDVRDSGAPLSYTTGGGNYAGYHVELCEKDDPAFKKAVDNQIRKLMSSGGLAKLHDKWFVQPVPPKNISVNLPMGSTLKGLLTNLNNKAAETYEKTQ